MIVASTPRGPTVMWRTWLDAAEVAARGRESPISGRCGSRAKHRVSCLPKIERPPCTLTAQHDGMFRMTRPMKCPLTGRRIPRVDAIPAARSSPNRRSSDR
jgi:hypothetical protein